MQEEAQRTHRRETLRSYHAPIGVRVSLSLLLDAHIRISRKNGKVKDIPFYDRGDGRGQIRKNIF